MTSFRKLSPQELQQKYTTVAPSYARDQGFGEIFFFTRPLRRQIMQKAQGRILDVACGTGENFRHFPKDSLITAIDLTPAMLAQAKQEADRLGMKIDFKTMNAEHLEFPDASFDTVVSALSTCTFPDPVAALREMGRVCHPEGRILLFEHGRSQWGWAGRWMDRHADSHFETVGCRWNQEPIELVKQAGLQIIHTRQARLGGVFSQIEAAPAL